MAETRGESRMEMEAAAVEELLRLFTADQIAAICGLVQAIREVGYGQVVIEIERKRLFLRGGVSIDLGRVRE